MHIQFPALLSPPNYTFVFTYDHKRTYQGLYASIAPRRPAVPDVEATITGQAVRLCSMTLS